MKLSSDQQYVMAVKKNGPVKAFDIYKAAIAVSNVGVTFAEEDKLSPTEVSLLNVRRMIFRAEFKEAEAILLNLKTEHPLLEADRQFLQDPGFTPPGTTS
jgi:6-phosphogluconolactonase (cycloisomerase 2 family)